MTIANRRRCAERGVLVAVAVCCVLFAGPARAWNPSEIRWMTISTEHFNIQYQLGLERYAERAAVIAESIYGPVTELYGYRPDGKIYFNISDTEDESQGSTYFYLNRIDITATPFDFPFRGSSDWLADVMTHEFTHMVSVQSSFKYPRWMPSLYLQGVNFEKEKRPDVINGYPNLMVSVPVPGELLPNWFAEGMAQFQCRAARHDMWDSHRDMILRAAVLDRNLLTLAEMGSFGKNSLGSERVYNQGFSLVRFIARRFGDDKLRELVSSFSSLVRWGFGAPCKRVLGVSDGELYRMWKDDLEAHYDSVAARVRVRPVEGTRETGAGFLNLCPVPARGTGGFYYLTNAGHDYMTLDLVYRGPDGRERTLASGLGSRFGVSPGGTEVCFVRRTRKNKYQYGRYDLYRYDLERRKAKRLTFGLRATSPAWSTDGKRIACVVTAAGSQRIAVVEAASGRVEFVTPFASGREYSGLSWGRDGILASRFDGASRDIVLVDPATGHESPIVATAADERDPSWDEGGKGFFYASDRTGIFNVYHHRADGSVDSLVTNCVGGAFAPRGTGADLLFSAYSANGYEIRSLRNWRAVAAPVDPREDSESLLRERLSISMPSDTARSDAAQRDESEPRSAGAAPTVAPAGKPFGIQYTSLFLYPRVLVYENKVRVGLFLDSGDYLGRQSVFAGASINSGGDFDLNFSLETRQFKPTLGVDVFRNRKYYSYRSRAEDDQNVMRDVDFNVRYDLWDSYFTCKMELSPTTEFYRNEAVLQYDHGEYGLNLHLWWLLKQREFGGEGGWNYYRANEFSLLWHYRNVREEVDADINPRSGRSIDVEVTRAYDKLFQSGQFEFAFKPIYNTAYFGRYMLTYEEYVPMPFWRHALSLRVLGGAIDASNISDFFYLYLGSLDGLRGYSYFSMGGRKIAMARLTYRFPLLTNVNREAFHLYVGSLYAAAFAEAGKAWNDDTFDLNGNKKDVGFDLRLKGFTFYSYPIAASFEAAYGLNDVVYHDPFNSVTTFYEGNRWKFYGSVLFSF